MPCPGSVFGYSIANPMSISYVELFDSSVGRDTPNADQRKQLRQARLCSVFRLRTHWSNEASEAYDVNSQLSWTGRRLAQ